ncbi:MAG: 3-oxoacyl-(acyl-carrier-protein) synthase [Planctomycetaceae bacterium]|nr:3-oxoacyl-(acyl-carrier-protein) synthase [Planctomycetaceae bacterium]
MVTPAGPDRESSWQNLVAGRRYIRWLTEAEHLEAGCDVGRTRLAGAPAMVLEAFRKVAAESARPVGSFVNSEHCVSSAILPNHLETMLFQAADEAAAEAGFVVPQLIGSQDKNETINRGDQDCQRLIHGREQDRTFAAMNSIESHRVGLVIGTSKGSLREIRESYLQTIQERKNLGTFAMDLEPAQHTWLDCWASGPAARLAARWDIHGPVLAPVAACATGMASICRGAELIRDGVCDIVFAGSVDDSLSEILWGSYRRLGVLARIQNDDPSTACRPFDQDRTGFLMGSGGAVIVLERWEGAVARGRTPAAEWLAGGTLSDATALTQVSSDAAGLTRLIGDLLRRGNITPRELDYINLHGTGTRDNDRYETQGIRQALGAVADQIPCSSLKGAIGHLLGGAGSVEFAATVLALRDGIIPPTCNLEHSAPECDLDYVPQVARRKSIQTALKLSLGFGGHLVGGLIRRV